MATVEINPTTYTKFVDASVESFTAQCLSIYGWEVQFGSSQPADTAPGLRLPGHPDIGVTRNNAPGHGWAKLASGDPGTTADVVVVP